MTPSLSRLYPAGRALLGVLFLISGILKIGGFAGTAAWMASAGLPLASVLLVLTIVIEIAGGLTLITGWNARWGALGLAVFLVPVSLVFHGFWSADAATFQNQLNHFLKNVSILGGMLVVYALESQIRGGTAKAQ
ncbi:DoxX family protein [Cupriavidus pinatubonensis]|jgi:putative oxidoreductase|uniref:Inner membrane protein YqjF n=1 Tax=Cupriavidus pinatubonensis TaxID=248026 RepID=A0ABM8XHP2_9BURK|nr:DoxX family protein [Cupriavidus pinatubonensis]CAG9179688.1 Inner membrane protein YqjF [Cupriavidus pinatubonensis]